MKKIAEKIVSEDMGARAQATYIRECYEKSNKACTLEQFTAAVSEEICNILGIE